jgi:malonate-semialdehyde dehydrogenase (acetylating)/methylmalonate-semialdehyde dehydrogenase
MSATLPRSSEVETRTLQNFVGGAWVDAAASELLDVTNPATAEVLARVPLSGADDVQRAVDAARAAFPAWRARSVIARSRLLYDVRALLVDHQDELARLVTTEMGKTLPDAKAEVGA